MRYVDDSMEQSGSPGSVSSVSERDMNARAVSAAAQLAMLHRTLPPSEIMPLGSLCVWYARAAVKAFGGNKTHAARALGINRRSLYRLLEREAA